MDIYFAERIVTCGYIFSRASFCCCVLCFQDDIKEYLSSEGVEWEESADLMEVASKCDIVYQTRIQRERFGERIDLYEEARGKYIVDQDILRVMQSHAAVMHPLPRLDEVSMSSLRLRFMFFVGRNSF